MIGQEKVSEVAEILRKRMSGQEEDELSESVLEESMCKALIELDIPFEQQLCLGNRRLDFVLYGKVNLEVDGRQYHTAEKDLLRDKEVAKSGLIIVRAGSLVSKRFPRELAARIVAYSSEEHFTSRVRQWIKRDPMYQLWFRVYLRANGTYLKMFV